MILYKTELEIYYINKEFLITPEAKLLNELRKPLMENFGLLKNGCAGLIKNSSAQYDINGPLDLIEKICDPVIVMAEGSVLFEGKFEEVMLKNFDVLSEVVSSIRKIRKEKQISNTEKLQLHIKENKKICRNMDPIICKLANIFRYIFRY